MSDLRGLGIDLCEISRMRELLGNASFLNRILTQAEQAYVAGKGAVAADTLAGIWAAKEAALKALGIGISIPMTDIEVAHTQAGQPQLILRGKALEASEGGTLRLSVTHEGGMAAAVCVWMSA